MGGNHWDAILASAPLNATAAAVTGRGTAFEPALAAGAHVAWDECPKLVDVRVLRHTTTSFVDLTGRRLGRLVVVGYVGKRSANKKALWACRCACGRYEGRHAATIVAAAADAMCDHCAYTRYLRAAASGDNARRRAESAKARKWRSPKERTAKDRAA